MSIKEPPANNPFLRMNRSRESGGLTIGGLNLVCTNEAKVMPKAQQPKQIKVMVLKGIWLYKKMPVIGPIAIAMLLKIPNMPTASPRLLAGETSIIRVFPPTEVDPIPKPCIIRTKMSRAIELAQG